MLNDPLANAMSAMSNAVMAGNLECTVPASKLIASVLKVMRDLGYIASFEPSGGEFKVELSTKLNKCGVIKPRFNTKKTEFDRYEKRYLPARDFGAVIVSTSRGVMSHYDAREHGIGGVLLAYVY